MSFRDALNISFKPTTASQRRHGSDVNRFVMHAQ